MDWLFIIIGSVCIVGSTVALVSECFFEPQEREGGAWSDW